MLVQECNLELFYQQSELGKTHETNRGSGSLDVEAWVGKNVTMDALHADGWEANIMALSLRCSVVAARNNSSREYAPDLADISVVDAP